MRKFIVSVTVLLALTACVPAEQDTDKQIAQFEKGQVKDKAHEQTREKAQKKAPAPKYTVSQENAIESAISYLNFAGFSRQGLIGQLTSEYGEGFPRKDALFAVDHIAVDWNAQAAKSAKSYLRSGSFSRQGLIDQLTSEYGEQFTLAQATYGVNKVGL